MKVFARLVVLIAAVVSVAASSSDILASPYEGITVLRIPSGNESSVVQLDQLISKLNLDRWTTESKTNSHIDVQVKQEDVDKFTESVNGILSSHGINQAIETMHDDLAASIRTETAGMFDFKATDAAVGLADNSWFNAYHTYSDHIKWLSDIASTFPNNSKVISMGKSYEGRDLSALNIFGSSGSGNKPAVVYHSTVHAREWITTMVNEYVAYQLLNNYQNSTAIKAIVDKFDFYILPFSNPDGFSFTQNSTRLWRKNRMPPPSGSTCYGRDINRNWAHSSWSQSAGASTDPCAEDYKGVAAADGPETKALAAFLDARAKSAQGAAMYMDWHSYSQLVMSPYGYTCSKNPADITVLNSLTSGFASALKAVHGTTFESGPICTTIYQVSGDSVDYAYDNSNIKYSFTAELRDTGRNGFVLPPEQIRPSGEEAWAGIEYILSNI